MEIRGILLLMVSTTALQSAFRPKLSATRVYPYDVVLQWDEINGASAYCIKLSDGQQKETANTTIEFGGLSPGSDYQVALTYKKEPNEQFSNKILNLTFKTNLPKVTNLRVVGVNQSMIILEWSNWTKATGYSLLVKHTNNSVVDDDEIVLTDNGAVITGLQTMTEYTIYIRAVIGDIIGQPAAIRTRTDGFGIKTSKQLLRDNTLTGGKAVIYGPLASDKPYAIQLEFTRPLHSIQIWHAKLQSRKFNRSSTTVLLCPYHITSNHKYNVHFKFEKKSEYCGGNKVVTVTFLSGEVCPEDIENNVSEFGEKSQKEEHYKFLSNSQQHHFTSTMIYEGSALSSNIVKNVDIEVERHEWNQTPATTEAAAGVIIFHLDSPRIAELLISKRNGRPREKFIIHFDSGATCPGGLVFKCKWGIKNISNRDRGKPIRRRTSFYLTNNALYLPSIGFMYGFNIERCSRRTNIQAELYLTSQDLHVA